MPDPTPTPVAAPAAPAFDLKSLGEAIAASVKTAVDAAIKPVHDAVAKLAPTAAADAAAIAADVKAGAADLKKDAQLTAADVKKLVGDVLGEFHTKTQTSAARDAYAADKLKDLPAIYRNQLPQTADAGQLAAAEQTIRAQYAADLKAAGITAPPVSGSPPAAGQPATRVPVDTSKMTGAQLIASGAAQRPIVTASAQTAELGK